MMGKLDPVPADVVHRICVILMGIVTRVHWNEPMYTLETSLTVKPKLVPLIVTFVPPVTIPIDGEIDVATGPL